MSEALAAKTPTPNTDRIVGLNKELGDLLLARRRNAKLREDLEREDQRNELRLRVVEAAIEGIGIATAAFAEQKAAARNEGDQ